MARKRPHQRHLSLEEFDQFAALYGNDDDDDEEEQERDVDVVQHDIHIAHGQVLVPGALTRDGKDMHAPVHDFFFARARVCVCVCVGVCV